MIKKGYYYHYKRNEDGPALNYTYEVLGTCLGTEDNKVYVLYKPLYEDAHIGLQDFYIRPYDMFTDKIIAKDRSIDRFKLITDEEVIESINRKIKDSRKII